MRKKLVNALREPPSCLIAGKVKVFIAVQNLIPKSTMFSFSEGTTVVLVFGTDVPETVNLKKNIESLHKYCNRVKIVFLPQVLSFEDELVRATDVKKVTELTRRWNVKNFKSDFCRLRTRECRTMLEKHSLDVRKLWEIRVPPAFSFVQNNGRTIKL